jgi:hypothetical protein
MTPKKPNKKTLTKEFINCYGNYAGLQSRLAKEYGLDVSYQQIVGWVQKDKTGVLEKAKTLGRERLKEFAELAAIKAMSEGKVQAICFVLKTLGRDLGYIEQTRLNPNLVGDLDITQTNSGEIDLTIKNVIVNSREDLERVYKGDAKPQIEHKTINSAVGAIDIVDGDFLTEK